MSRLQNIIGRFSIAASGALTKQHFIGLDGAICGVNSKSLGVLELDVADTEQASVISPGSIAIIEAGGIVNAGDPVTSDASGKAIAADDLSTAAGAVAVLADAATPAFTGGVLPQAINGYALEAAAADGDLIAILVV